MLGGDRVGAAGALTDELHRRDRARRARRDQLDDRLADVRARRRRPRCSPSRAATARRVVRALAAAAARQRSGPACRGRRARCRSDPFRPSGSGTMADPMSSPLTERPAGIPGSAPQRAVPGRRVRAKVRDEMRARPRLQLFGEVWGLQVAPARVWFELRDAEGALPCSMWRDDFERLGLAADALRDGVQVVVAGGPDYYPGSRTASPGFSFAVTALRIAGEGDLLAQLDRLRKLLDGEGLFAPQKALGAPALPRTIGVVTSDGGKARDDVLAGLRAPRLGRAARVGVRAGAGPPRGAAHHRARCRTSRRPAAST